MTRIRMRLPTPTIVLNQDRIVLNAAAAGEIRFTLDGSEPGPAAELYFEPIPVLNDVTVKARLFSPGHRR